MQKSVLVVFISILVAAFFFGCQSNRNPSLENKTTISVSILPQKYLIDQLTDSTIEVNVMVPPGTSPEMYEPSPVQMKNVAKSVVYFAVGPLEFENSILPRIKELNPSIRFANLSKGINLIAGHKHHEIMGDQPQIACYDPHVWTSTSEFRQMASEACKVLCEVFPEKKSKLESNLIKINSNIDSLDNYVKKIISKAKTKNFIIYHPALTYFAREYGLNQIAIEEDGKNPSAQKLTNLVKFAKADSLKFVFIQSQFDSRNAEIIAGELDGEIASIDPLGYDWLKNMYDLSNKLSIALRSGVVKQNE